MSVNDRLIKGSVILFYFLIGLEIVIMISPFAGFFYAGYGPVLNILYDVKATSWLTGFFLPHAVIARNDLLNFLNGLGRFLFSFGLIAFFIGAVQIYSAKFRRKGVVSSILYRWVRHPQYLFLAISGLGLLLFWPRFIILILYISMLYVYYLLAKNEEDRMLKQHGDSYAAYMQRTAMFIPGKPGQKGFLVHLMPVHYRMQGLFVAPFNAGIAPGRISTWKNVVDFVFPSLSLFRHKKMMGKMNSDDVLLIFSQLTWPDGEYAPYIYFGHLFSPFSKTLHAS